MNKFIYYTCIFALCATFSTAQNSVSSVQQKISGWQTNPALTSAGISIAVSDNQTNEKLIETKPHLSLIPASILKTITTATALEVFGPDFRFQTTLSYAGIVRNDTLFGDLQIIGGGDPTLGSGYFPESKSFQEEWIKALKESNIKVITGNLDLDATIYESQMIPGTWIWEDIGNYFGAGASGISVFDNTYEIHLKSGSEAGMPTQIVRIVPEIPNLELTSEALSSDFNSDQSLVFGSPEESKRVIRGTIPKNQADFVVKASVPNPSVLLASEFRKKLVSNGILIAGVTKFEKVVSSRKLAVIQSPPLREIIKVTNH